MAVCTQDSFTYIKIDPERSFIADNGKLYAYLVGFECEEARVLDKIRTPQIQAFISNLKNYAQEHKDDLSTLVYDYYMFIVENWQYIFGTHARHDELILLNKFTADERLLAATEKLSELGLDGEWWRHPIVYTRTMLFDCSLINISVFDINKIYAGLKEYYNVTYDGDLKDC